MELYVTEDGKRLRCGYTTGTTAALAAQAAVRILLQGEDICNCPVSRSQACERRVNNAARPGSRGTSNAPAAPAAVSAQANWADTEFCRHYIPCAVMTPKGIRVEADALVCEAGKDPDYAVCAVKKDGGDDQDVTNGLLIYARAEWIREGSKQSRESAEGEGLRERTQDPTNNIVIECGEGIGTVTKPGLSVPVGEKALNPVPRRMIEDAVRRVLSEYTEEEDTLRQAARSKSSTGNLDLLSETKRTGKGKASGVKITLSVPGGEKVARSTFNERLGIIGGISIIGTSGIVEPMSKKAFADAVCVEIRQQAALGKKRLILTPGNYGEDFIRKLESAGIIYGEREKAVPNNGDTTGFQEYSFKETESENMPGKVLFSEDLGIVAITEVGRKIVGMTAQPGLEGRNKKGQDITENAEQSITSGPVPDLSDYGVVVCSNFIGEALDEVINDGFEEVLLIGHAGKLVKLAGGIMNTHSRMADCRMELICAHAAVQGAGSELCKRIMGASTTEAAFSLIRAESEELLKRVLNALLSAIQFHLNERIRKHEKGMESSLQIGAVMFFKV